MTMLNLNYGSERKLEEQRKLAREFAEKQSLRIMPTHSVSGVANVSATGDVEFLEKKISKSKNPVVKKNPAKRKKK